MRVINHNWSATKQRLLPQSDWRYGYRGTSAYNHFSTLLIADFWTRKPQNNPTSLPNNPLSLTLNPTLASVYFQGCYGQTIILENKLLLVRVGLVEKSITSPKEYYSTYSVLYRLLGWLGFRSKG